MLLKERKVSVEEAKERYWNNYWRVQAEDIVDYFVCKSCGRLLYDLHYNKSWDRCHSCTENGIEKVIK